MNGKASGGGTVAPRTCAVSDVSATALAYSGFFAGNLLSGRPGDITAQQSALASIGFNWNGDFAQVSKISSLGGQTHVDFSTAEQNPLSRLYGDTWIGVHFGNGAGLGGNATGFWRLDAGLEGLKGP